jgi:PAS domain S-box-containing protein
VSAPGPHSLRFQLTAAFVVVAVVPTALLAAYALVTSLRDAEQRLSAGNRLVAEAVGGEVERFLDAQLVHMREIALAARDGQGRGRARAAHVALHLAANPALKSILFLDASGRVESAAPDDPDLLGVDFSRQPWWRRAMERAAPSWSSAAISLQTGQPTVTVVVPYDDQGAVVGFLDLAVLREVAARTVREVRFPGVERRVVAVVDADGTFIAHPDQRIVRERVNVGDVPVVRQGLAGHEGTAEASLLGQDVIVSAAFVEPSGWAVLVIEPVEAALAPLHATRNGLLAALAAAVVLSLAGGVIVSRRLARPIEALADGTRALAAGEAPAPLPRGGFAETEALAGAFEAMAAAVRAREEALARSEREHRQLLEAPLVGVARTAPDGRIRFANRAFAQMLGAPSPEALVGRSAVDLYVDPRQRAEVMAQLGRAGRVENVELHLRRLDGTPLVALTNVALDGGVTSSVMMDVTTLRQTAAERARLEEQLRHAQKLEAVGRLAGGVAHDFNNLLTAITGFGTVLRDALPPDHPERESADAILHSAERAAHLTQSLLAYSRKQVLRPRPIDLRDTVQVVERLARRVLGEDVELVVRLEGRRLTVLADAGQLEQVLLNLCTNARDAMPRGGRITVEAGEETLSESEAVELELAAGGRFARVSVTDSGEGMSREVRERIFEPFFTTKGSGRGTGLGLAIVYGIVRQHDGAVRVRSEPGEGSSFTVFLPLAAGTAEVTQASAAAPLPAPRGTETILVAEDEPLVRKVIRTALERAGYEVLEAVDGHEAVEVYRRHRDRVKLCLLDVVMPRLNGKEALAAIQLICPGARAVFASGYAADVLTARGLAEGGAELVQKPIAPVELLRVVRAALDRAA